MKYRLEIARSAEREIRRLPEKIQFGMAHVFHRLQDDPRPPGSKKLKSASDLWRIRIGAYRAIYSIADVIKLIRIEKVGHRSDVYR